MNFFKFLLLCFISYCVCLDIAYGILFSVYDAVVKYLIRDAVDWFIGPATKALIGGPTTLAAFAIKYATPLINTSVFGERFDQFVYTTLGWGVGLLINVIITIVQQSLEWSIETVLLFIQGVLVALDGIIKKKRSLSYDGPLGLISSFIDSSKERWSSRQRRYITDLSSNVGSYFYDDGFLLSEDPEIEKFLRLISKDEEDCLKELLCSIYAAPDAAITKEETSLKYKFQKLISKVNKNILNQFTPYLNATTVGSEKKSQLECQKSYPKCSHPYIFRAVYNFVHRFSTYVKKKMNNTLNST